MHAVVVKVTIKDFEPARDFLLNQVVPQASQAPGFVAGYWTRGEDGNGLSMVVFESEEAARAATERVQMPSGGEVELDSVEVREVVAHA